MFGVPGTGAAAFNQTTELLWGGDESRVEVLRLDGQIASTATDAGATVASTLRAGMLLGKITSSGKLDVWDPALTTGLEHFHSVNGAEQRMIDNFGTAVDRFGPVIVKAPLKASALLIKGTAFIGNAFEYLARRQLHEAGCRLDDDPHGYLAGLNRRVIDITATGPITAAQNGALFVVRGSAAVTLTLPTLVAGLNYQFINTTDQNLIIASAAGDDVIALNDATADSIAFSTSSQKIGAFATVNSVLVNGTARWITDRAAATVTIAT
jgi:hypothetical protein